MRGAQQPRQRAARPEAPEEALASYDRAIALKPDYAEAYNNRGNALHDLKRPADALASYDKAIALKPDYAEAYNNRGNALQDLKRPAEALASYDKAIALKPDYAEAYWNQSLCLLLMGRFEQGWRQYEWRKKRDEPIAARSYPQPLWLGEEEHRGQDPVHLVGARAWRHDTVLPIRQACGSAGREGHYVSAAAFAWAVEADQPNNPDHWSETKSRPILTITVRC